MDTDDTPLPAHKPAFLRRVQIRGYKSIAFCDVTLEPLTILVGRNASGKSNFLDALGFLRDMLRYGVSEAVEKHGGRDSVLCKSTDRSRGIEFHLDCQFTVEETSGFVISRTICTAKYCVKIALHKKSFPRVVSEECFCESEGRPIARFKAIAGFAHIVNPHGSLETHSLIDNLSLHLRPEPAFVRLAELLRSFQVHSFDTAAIREIQKSQHHTVLQFNGKNLASVLESTIMEEPKSVERIKRYLAAIVPDILFIGTGISGSYRMLKFRRSNNGEPIGSEFDASSMSDGTLRALAALTAVFQNVHEQQELSVVAIEEPETALHPAAMRALVSAFDAATLNTQVLLTTHSPDLIDAEEINPENVRIVQMIEGQTVIGPIDEASVEIVKRNLDTLGGLERNDSLHIDFDDRRRQLALETQSSDAQP